VSVFNDQKKFMDITGQKPSEEMIELYMDLIDEEMNELCNAYGVNDVVEMADGAIDLIYVTIGLLHSMGLDPQALWDEVQRSNMSKFLVEACVFCGTKGCEHCNGTGEFFKVLRREDGKILKGPKYKAPDLSSIVTEQLRGK
jgi:phosphoribosyl-ATP pyrophosphohydrolase